MRSGARRERMTSLRRNTIAVPPAQLADCRLKRASMSVMAAESEHWVWSLARSLQRLPMLRAFAVYSVFVRGPRETVRVSIGPRVAVPSQGIKA